jgi:hypothetical protein
MGSENKKIRRKKKNVAIARRIQRAVKKWRTCP